MRLLGRLTSILSTRTRLRTLSYQSSTLFEAKGTRDDEQWQAYAQTIDPLDLPTVSRPAATLPRHRLIDSN
jgi:hypothetical protein